MLAGEWDRLNATPAGAGVAEWRAQVPGLRAASGPEGRLLLRGQRFFHPAVKLLLVGFDPAINVTLNIRF